MKKIQVGVVLGLVGIMIAVPVLAAYWAEITVTESNGTTYTQLALNQDLNVDYLAANGFITSTGLDTRVTDEDYTVLPHMLADDRLLWVSPITGNSETTFWFVTGEDALSGFPIITGHGGYVTVTDAAALELGDVFAIGVIGYIDTSAGSDKNIIRKDSAVLFNVSSASTLTFAVTGGNSLVATSVSSGVMTIMIYSDGYEMWMEIDDVEQDRDTTSAIPNTANDWVLFENDVMPYVYYYSMWEA